MKKLFTFLLLGLFCQIGFAQNKLSSTDWQADLLFLQKTVHKDYPFLFKKTTAEAFDAEIKKLHAAIPSLQDHEIIVGITRIVALFQYGHTDVSWREVPVKLHLVPVAFYRFNDGIYVEGVQKDYSSTLGAKLVKVEGKPVDEVLAALRPLLPVENEQYFKAHALDYLCSPEALHAQKVTKTLQNSITFTFEKEGKTFEQPFKALESFRFPRRYGFVQPNDQWLSVRDQIQTPYYLKNLDKIYYFEYLTDSKTVYIRHSQIQDDPSEDIPTFYKRVFEFVEKNDVERLVLDVRLNGGGNNYKNKPIVQGVIKSKINQPGKFFVILGRRTFSACQNLVNELDNYTEAIFVGEPTAENINFYGDTRRVELPNSKIPVFLSFAWWQDKPQWENADWLAPHLAVDMSLEDYRSNRDPVLATALAFKSENFVRSPIRYLEQLFTSNQIDKLKSEAARLVKDPLYRYINFEREFNERAYQMMGRNQMEPALFVLELNTQLFPQSANAWDSLGEVYWKMKQKEKAIAAYQKAISLDPRGETGKNAQKMLGEIQKG